MSVTAQELNTNLTTQNQDDVCEILYIDEVRVRAVEAQMPVEETILAVSEVFKVLSDPTRARIVFALSQTELCVCDLTRALDIAQPKISRHLKILRETGVLLDRRQGQWIHYRLHPELGLWAAQVVQAYARGCGDKEPYATDRRRMTASDLVCG